MSSQLRRKVLSAAAIVAFWALRIPGVASGELPRSPGIESSPEVWELLCDQAVGADADQVVAILRATGIRGWEEFRRRHRSTIEGLAERPACLCDPDSPERRVAAALDKISAQRDAASSGLYWYTDLKEAIVAAKQGPKPILSLRLLGRLDDDLSCANSRFFRTTLYADAELAKYLRDHFVLHWESVRPIPVITIDFGDGRTMRRTITGNSAHYVLDPQGRVVDCLPGLYAPAEFRRRLDDAERIARVHFPKSDEEYRLARLSRYHQDGIRRIDETVREAGKPMPTTTPRAEPVLNVPIAEVDLLKPVAPLPTALGETLLAPRPDPEPIAGRAVPVWTFSSSVMPNVKATLVMPMDATLGMKMPSFQPPQQRRSIEMSVPRPNSRQVRKMRVEGPVVAAVSPSLQVRFESGQLVFEAPKQPAPPTAPTPGGSPGTIDTGAIVTKALAAALPSFEVDVPGWPAHYQWATNRQVSVYREPGRVFTKGRVEQPLENAVRSEMVRSEPPAEPPATDDVLPRLAGQIRGDLRLSTGSLKLIRAKFDSTPAEPVEGLPEWRFKRFDRMLAALRASIADDTARNEYDLHRRIHAWLAADPNIDLAKLNERVYAELFLMPRSDPWLGLAPADAFPALDQGGLFVEP